MILIVICRPSPREPGLDGASERTDAAPMPVGATGRARDRASRRREARKHNHFWCGLPRYGTL